jgi:hypothetical protein
MLNKPDSFNKPGAVFLGWVNEYGYGNLYQPGQILVLDYDSGFTAVWGGDSSDFTYTIAGNTVTITGYTGSSYLAIPSQIEGKNVTAIGSGVFYQKEIQEVSLPSTLEIIGLKAFMGNFIKTLELPNSVKTIKAKAFQDCYLQTLTFGTGLEEIGDDAFNGSNLITLEFPALLKTIGIGAFLGTDIYEIKIGAGVNIVSDDSLANHEQSFKAYYDAYGKAAGSYEFRGEWTGPAQE